MADRTEPPQPPYFPEPPRQGPKLRPNEQDVLDLKTTQKLVTVASIAGPVSLFIGGMFLSAAGLVCGFVASRKLKALAAKLTDVSEPAKRLKRSCIIAMAVCAIAFALNAVSAYVMYPEVLKALESGSYDLGYDKGEPDRDSIWG